jgi:hypothetical protein
MKKWQKSLEDNLGRLKSGAVLTQDEIRTFANYYESKFMFEEEDMTLGQSDYWYKRIEKLRSYIQK